MGIFNEGNEILLQDFIEYCAKFKESSDDIRIVVADMETCMSKFSESGTALRRLNDVFWEGFKSAHRQMPLKKRHYIFNAEHSVLGDKFTMREINQFWKLMAYYARRTKEMDLEDAELICKVDDELRNHLWNPQPSKSQQAVITHAARMTGYKTHAWLDPDYDGD